MEKWGMFEFNSPYFGEIIEKINDVVLPNDYIELMKKHNGGEGDIGETWLILYPLEELQEINDDYEIEEILPGHIIIGSNGGGELYGIDNKGNYFNVPVPIDEDDVALLGTEIELLDEQIISFEVVERIKLWDYLINLKELKRKRIIENFRLKIVLTLPALPATMCWRGISLYYTFLTMRTGIGSFYAAKTIRKKMREWFP